MAYDKAWRKANPDKWSAQVKRRRDRQQARKAGRPRPVQCEVCAKAVEVVFDHCHQCGLFRGWICTNCNLALGRVTDSPQILQALAVYVVMHTNEKACPPE